MHAYRETFLNKAMINTGDMFDCLIHDFGMKGDDLVNMFIASSICRRLENGEPKYLIGMSGIELANRSGVSLRSIQMYEQRNKDINKAQSGFLASISRTLGCRIEDLLEI